MYIYIYFFIDLYVCLCLYLYTRIYIYIYIFERCAMTVDATDLRSHAPRNRGNAGTATPARFFRATRVRAYDDRAIGSFCKEFLCVNTMPCRHMPLLVHF